MSESAKNLDILQSLHEKNQSSRDQALLTLGSATLGFTITIFSTIYKGQAIALVVITWLSLVVSIVSLLFSYGTAAATSDKILSYHNAADSGETDKKRRYELRFRHYLKVTKRLNRYALISYIVALASFVSFAIVNVLQPSIAPKILAKPVEVHVIVEYPKTPTPSLPKSEKEVSSEKVISSNLSKAKQ